MTRRASLPGAAELFRATSAASGADATQDVHHPGVGAVTAVPSVPESSPSASGAAGLSAALSTVAPDLVSVPDPAPDISAGISRAAVVRGSRRIRAVGDRAPSGRERHEEKITVYCSGQELIELESARLQLRAEHGLAVDRGRIVREAMAVVLADLDAKGESSILVRRLREA